MEKKPKINISSYSTYHLSRDGRTTEGPYQVPQIRKMWKSGAIPANAQLRDYQGVWFPAERLMLKVQGNRNLGILFFGGIALVALVLIPVKCQELARQDKMLRDAAKSAPPIERTRL